jgi:hypothetical protein
MFKAINVADLLTKIRRDARMKATRFVAQSYSPCDVFQLTARAFAAAKLGRLFQVSITEYGSCDICHG